MKTAIWVGLVLAAGVIAGPAWAAPQPPMDNFDNAFYVCDGDHTFLISYDSDTPTAAKLTTNDNKAYELKRDAADNGVSFAGDGAKFWTDGKGVTVQGTTTALKACKRKGG